MFNTSVLREYEKNSPAGIGDCFFTTSEDEQIGEQNRDETRQKRHPLKT